MLRVCRVPKCRGLSGHCARTRHPASCWAHARPTPAATRRPSCNR